MVNTIITLERNSGELLCNFRRPQYKPFLTEWKTVPLWNKLSFPLAYRSRIDSSFVDLIEGFVTEKCFQKVIKVRRRLSGSVAVGHFVQIPLGWPINVICPTLPFFGQQMAKTGHYCASAAPYGKRCDAICLFYFWQPNIYSCWKRYYIKHFVRFIITSRLLVDTCTRKIVNRYNNMGRKYQDTTYSVCQIHQQNPSSLFIHFQVHFVSQIKFAPDRRTTLSEKCTPVIDNPIH